MPIFRDPEAGFTILTVDPQVQVALRDEQCKANFSAEGIEVQKIFEFRSKRGFRILCEQDEVEKLFAGHNLTLQGDFKIVRTRHFVGVKIETSVTVSIDVSLQMVAKALGVSPESLLVHRIVDSDIVVFSVTDVKLWSRIRTLERSQFTMGEHEGFISGCEAPQRNSNKNRNTPIDSKLENRIQKLEERADGSNKRMGNLETYVQKIEDTFENKLDTLTLRFEAKLSQEMKKNTSRLEQLFESYMRGANKN
jgi:hypothetical protein